MVKSAQDRVQIDRSDPLNREMAYLFATELHVYQKKIDVRFSPKAVDHRALQSAIACSRVVE
jgi:hypothetical protein